MPEPERLVIPTPKELADHMQGQAMTTEGKEAMTIFEEMVNRMVPLLPQSVPTQMAFIAMQRAKDAILETIESTK